VKKISEEYVNRPQSPRSLRNKIYPIDNFLHGLVRDLRASFFCVTTGICRTTCWPSSSSEIINEGPLITFLILLRRDLSEIAACPGTGQQDLTGEELSGRVGGFRVSIRCFLPKAIDTPSKITADGSGPQAGHRISLPKHCSKEKENQAARKISSVTNVALGENCMYLVCVTVTQAVKGVSDVV